MSQTDREKVEPIRQLLGRKRVRADELAADWKRLQNLKTVNQPFADRDDYD